MDFPIHLKFENFRNVFFSDVFWNFQEELTVRVVMSSRQVKSEFWFRYERK